jgi:putative membrane protein
MVMQAEKFFSPAEKERISQAIAAVEKMTAGEVAVVAADESDRYPEAAILAGMTLGSVIALLITDLLFHDSLWFFLPIALLAGFAIGWLTGRVPALKRFFVPQARIEEEVAQRALQVFYDKGLHKTRDATGVLFFISLLEHKAWVLADQGIYQKISQEKLNQHAVSVATGIKQGRAAEVLCQEIQQVGITLARHFPIKADDTNELPNEVQTA